MPLFSELEWCGRWPPSAWVEVSHMPQRYPSSRHTVCWPFSNVLFGQRPGSDYAISLGLRRSVGDHIGDFAERARWQTAALGGFAAVRFRVTIT
jgi:hypothetical protein